MSTGPENEPAKIILQSLLDEIARLKKEVAVIAERESHRYPTHDGPCYYCGKPTQSLSSNPHEWPVHLCHADEPGIMKPHHAGCAHERIDAEHERDNYKASLDTAVKYTGWLSDKLDVAVDALEFYCENGPDMFDLGKRARTALAKIGDKQ